MTPIGLAIGLGVRRTYNPENTTPSIVSETLDSLSAGVLLYTGLVEVSNSKAFSAHWYHKLTATFSVVILI